MQTSSRIGRSGVATLWSAFAILSLVLAVEVFTETKLGEMRMLALRTYELTNSIWELRTSLADSMAARRGAALDPTPGARDALARTLRRARRDLNDLRSHSAHHAFQSPWLERLDPRIQSLLDDLRAALPATADALDLPRERIYEASENSRYDAIATALAESRDAQLLLLARYMSSVSAISRRARAFEGFGVVISVGLLLLVFRRLRSEIARRRLSEDAQRESELRLATTLDSIGDAVIVTDVHGQITRMNPVAEQFSGMTLEQARGKPFDQVFPVIDERSGAPVDDPVQRTLRERMTIELPRHTALRSRDSQTRPIADSAAPIRDAHGEITGVVIVFRDISEERAAERRVQEATAFLDSIVENLPNMVFVKEPDELRFVRINKAGEELLSTTRAALVGKNDFDFFPPEQAEFFQAKDRDVLDQRALLDIAAEPIQTSAGVRWLHTKKIPILDDTGKPRYLLGISEDITEKRAIAEELMRAKEDLERRVEQRTRDLRDANEELKRENGERKQAEIALQKSESLLRQSQKMEAIGRLAGGVAHDFNNLLSVILSYGDLVQRSLPSDSPLRADVEQITRACMRAADLTRQLLAFSRQQVLAPKVIDLNASLSTMHRMLQRVIGEDIELCTVPSQELARVRVDPGQIEQVILNLAVNARDAMPSGGLLTIETSNVLVDPVQIVEHTGLNPGPHVVLSVRDTGAGMSRDTQARIFEPFFTTKEQGKGTGLGLATVFGIVQQSGGAISVNSELEHGTTFRIYLPRVTGSLDSVGSTSPFRALVVGGHETVLLVEDDEQVRVLAKTVLERHGFRVIAAAGCEEALRVVATFKEPIQLLLTDVVMPRMSGRQLAEKLTLQRPRMKVLFMSGYTDDTVIHHGVLQAGMQFLQKPLTPEGLTRKVREVLDTG
jgi:two-component system, cell cycle sensor histidine kinase and response regulator CckA